MSKEFYVNRNKVNIEKVRKLLKSLPPFCAEFFMGVENRTSVLTRVGYAYDLRIFFDFLSKEIAPFYGKEMRDFTLQDLQMVAPTHLEQFQQYLSYYKFNEREYVNSEFAKARKMATVKTMFKYFYRKEKLEKDVASKVEMPKLHAQEITRLEVDEVVKLLNEAEEGGRLVGRERAFHDHTKDRDIAMLTLFLGTGIRISECVGLNIGDVDFATNSIRIIRKGGNEAVLYFSDEVASALSNYLAVRRKKKDDTDPALFLSLQNKRISVRAVEMLVKKYASRVTPLKHITPHKLRSTYGTALYRETKDIYIVADVLGHKDVNTTKKHYAAISDDLRRAAANKVRLREDAPLSENSEHRKDKNS